MNPLTFWRAQKKQLQHIIEVKIMSDMRLLYFNLKYVLEVDTERLRFCRK